MKRRTSESSFQRSPLGYSATTRRRFLQTSAAVVSGLALANCNRGLADVQSGSGESPTPSSSSGTLHVYTWADYTDDELAATFKERTGIDVIIDVYDSNEIMLAKLQAGGGAAYSVIYPSDYMVAQMIEEGLLTELDHTKIKGLSELYPNWENPPYDPGNVHSVPYSWGTTGILYNQDLVGAEIKDWEDLWTNLDVLERRITLLDDVREVMGAALKSLGYSYNASDPAQIEAAYQRLVELKPAISSFKTFGWEDQILSDDLFAVMSYSVDAISATLEDPNLNYVIPASGSSVWTDTMVIPKSAPNPEAAYAWINLMLEPEIVAGVVERLSFATPLKPAFALLSKELQENPDLFPPEEILAKCEGIAPLDDETTKLYDRFWTQLTSA
ncbi:MAG: spermidine/putrescine ABC transporter substrate-binding protein [Synechococcales cyanobacterium T60_A2020_003]|nr:spermidine/putrescine ABC transporter substrate-binding protein [Synechococcales cyanobacterium T60_A2020_003]